MMEPSPPRNPPAGIESVVSAEVHASPCQMRGAVEDDAPFWKPSFFESLQHMGWRWFVVVPSIAIVVLLPMGMIWSSMLAPLWWLGPKFYLMLLAIPVTTFSVLVRTAIQRRTDPFCIHCGYDLLGLPDQHTCPECGRPYTFAMIEEYRRDPHWFIRRWKTQHQIPVADAPFKAGTVMRRRSRDGT